MTKSVPRVNVGRDVMIRCIGRPLASSDRPHRPFLHRPVRTRSLAERIDRTHDGGRRHLFEGAPTFNLLRSQVPDWP